MQARDEAAELAEEYALLCKLKRGKMSDHEFDRATGLTDAGELEGCDLDGSGDDSSHDGDGNGSGGGAGGRTVGGGRGVVAGVASELQQQLKKKKKKKKIKKYKLGGS
jgi:hypothetical protein